MWWPPVWFLFYVLRNEAALGFLGLILMSDPMTEQFTVGEEGQEVQRLIFKCVTIYYMQLSKLRTTAVPAIQISVHQ